MLCRGRHLLVYGDKYLICIHLFHNYNLL